MTYIEYAINLNGKQPIFEFGKQGYFYVDFDDVKQRLMYGSVCNVGFIEYGGIDYDDGLTFEENLQILYDTIIQDNPKCLEEE